MALLMEAGTAPDHVGLRGLRENLGIDPTPAVTQVHDAILRHDPSLDSHLAAPMP